LMFWKDCTGGATAVIWWAEGGRPASGGRCCGSRVVDAQGRHCLWMSASASWAPQRDSVAAARSTRRQRGRAATVGRRLKRSCVAVPCSSCAVQQVQARRCPAVLSVVCCPVSGEPVRRRSMQACRRVQRTAAAAGPDRQGDSDTGQPRTGGGRGVVDGFDVLSFEEREGGRRSLGLAWSFA
jgi:hypothetical protein